MKKKQKIIAAGQFKNRCLALMDEVNEDGIELVVTKHGQPVVRIVPAEKSTSKYPILGSIVGSVTYREEDITSPEGDSWNAEQD